MKKRLKQTLAWLLILTMFWQNAGVEVLAASTVLTETDTTDETISGDVSDNDMAGEQTEDAASEDEKNMAEEDPTPVDTETDGEDEGNIPSEGETPETDNADESVPENEETEPSADIEIQPVYGEAEQEAELYAEGEESPLYWTAEAIKKEEHISLTDGTTGKEGFSDFAAAADAVFEHASTAGNDGYEYIIHRKMEVVNVSGANLSVGSLENMPGNLKLTLDLAGETVDVVPGAVINYNIQGAGMLCLPENGTVTVQADEEDEEISLKELTIVYPETENTTETLVLHGDGIQCADIYLESVDTKNAAGQDAIEMKGNVIAAEGSSGEFYIPKLKISTEENWSGHVNFETGLRVDKLELDGSLETTELAAGDISATSAAVLRLHGTTSVDKLDVVRSDRGEPFTIILSNVVDERNGYRTSPELKLAQVMLADGINTICFRKENRNIKEVDGEYWEETAPSDFLNGDIVASIPADNAEAVAGYFMTSADWQHIEAEPASDGTYNLIVSGMDMEKPLWVWQEPVDEGSSRVPIGSVSAFAEAKALIQEKAAGYTSEEQKKMHFTIDVKQPGMKITGDVLDYSAMEYHVSVDVSEELTNQTLSASGTVALGGNLYIQGDITGVNAVIKAETDENGNSSCVNIAGTLKLSGTLALNGELIAGVLSVTGMTTASAQGRLHIRRSAVLGNLTVKGDGNVFEKSDSFRVYLTHDLESDEWASLSIKGNVTKSGSMEYPVTFVRESGIWDGNGNFIDGEAENFPVGTVLASLTKNTSYVPTNYFRVDDDSQCVIRNGNMLQVSGTAVRVSCGDISRNYDSLEAARAGIAAAVSQNGFGSRKGTYDITVLQDCALSTDVAFPACVTGLNLNAAVDFEEENPAGIALNLSGKTITANSAQSIHISDGLTVYNGKLTANAATEIIADAVVLPNFSSEEASLFNLPVENLTVTAANAEFYLNTKLTKEYSEEEFAVMERMYLALDFGRNDGRVNLNVKSLGFGEKFFGTEVSLNSLTLNAGVSSIDYALQVDSLVMKGSRLYIDAGAELRAKGTVTVNSAYARDNGSQYYTIENNGGYVSIDTLNMAAGTLYNGPWYREDGTNDANMYIHTVKRVAKLCNGDDAVFKTHSFSQTKSDKTYLFGESEFVIEDEEADGIPAYGNALIYNLVLQGNSSVKKSKKAALSVYGTPAYNSSSDSTCTIRIEIDETDEKGLTDGYQLLTANISSNFPVEMFRAVEEGSWNNPDASEERGEFLLYQEKTKIFVSEARFVVFKEGVNDSKYLGSFATWTQASACISAMNDAAAAYYVEVNPDATGILDIGGSFALPSKAKSIYFNYTNNEKSSADQAGDEKIPDLCTLIYTGNLNLTTNVTFHNFMLKPQASATKPNPTAVALNAKTLELQCSGGYFASVTGKGGSTLSVTANPAVYDGELTVTGNLSGVTNLILSGSWGEEKAVLTVNGSVAATNLELNHGYYEEQDTGAAHLDAGTKVTLTNVKVNGQDNRISYGGNTTANILYITGTISSDDNNGIAYRETEDGQKECLYYKENAITVVPKALEGKYDGQKVLRAAKAPCVWFVTENPDGSKQYTARAGDYIYGTSGDSTLPAVRLERNTAAGESDWEIYSYYETVKEAFAEINKLNDKTKSYRVILQDAKAESTKVTENLTFPSKAGHLFVGVEGTEEDEFYFNFKSALKINCNTEFDNVVLNTPGGSIALSNYELTFTDCDMAESAKITGISGTASKAVLVLDNTFLDVKGSVTGIGTLIMGRAEKDGENLYACVTAKTLSVTNIVANYKNCELAVGATFVRNKKTSEITKVTPGLTISGTVTGNPVTVTMLEYTGNHVNAVAFYDKESEIHTEGEDSWNSPSYIWGSAYKTKTDIEGEEAAYEYRGIYLANAKKVSADMIRLNTENTKTVADEAKPVGMLYKSGGYVTYMSTDEYEVKLLYDNADGTPAWTPCITFADAVKEINNLSTARAYTMELQKDIGTGEDSRTAPMKLTLPSKGKASMLTITSAAFADKTGTGDGQNVTQPYTIYYQGNITANTGLTLKNVGLAQKVGRTVSRATTWYLPENIPDYYSAGVTLKTAYELVIAEDVSFDGHTPVLLDGSSYAGSLVIDDGVKVSVQKVNGFKSLTVDGTLKVSKYPTSFNKKTGVYKYAGGTVSARTVMLENTGLASLEEYLLEAEDSLNVTSALTLNASGSCTNIFVHAGKITVKNLELRADDGTATDMAFLHHCEIVSDTSMAISGTVSNTGHGNTLATYRASASANPTLTISGGVTLLNEAGDMDAENRIIVRVNGPKSEEDNGTAPLVLDSASKLVTAPKSMADQFEADVACLEDGNKELYSWDASANGESGIGESVADKKGYILQKIGNYVNVYYADKIVAAAYVGHNGDGDLSAHSENILGYYISFADAVAAINAQKDKTADYSIVLLQDVGGNTTEKKPVSLTLPGTKAWVYVVSEKGQEHTIYYTNNISLKSHLELNHVVLAPQKLVNKVYQPAALDIATGAYGLHLLCDVAEGCSVRNLTGTGYVTTDGSPVYVIDSDAGNLSGKLQLTKGAVQISSDIKIAGLLNVQELIVDGTAKVNCTGNLTAKQLTFTGGGSIEGKAAMSIGNIAVNNASNSDDPSIYTYRTAKNLSQLAIMGKVTASEKKINVIVCQYGTEKTRIQTADYLLTYPDNGYQVQVPAVKKLADMKSEYLSYFDFECGEVLKYNGGVYCYSSDDLSDGRLNTHVVTLHGGIGESSVCMDLAQAAAEIKNLAEPETVYAVVLSSETDRQSMVDANVTDRTRYSAFAFPAANTCERVDYYLSSESAGEVMIAFLASSGLKPAGQVTVSGLTLAPVNDKGVSTAVNIAMSKSNASKEYPSALIFDNCVWSSPDGTTDGLTFVNTISGVKNVSMLSLNNTDLCVKGAVSNLNVLDIRQSHLTTLGNVTVNTAEINDVAKAVQDLNDENTGDTEAVQWDAYGAVTIAKSLESECGMTNTNSYIAANRVAKTPAKPTFTLNGTVKESLAKLFRFRVYRYKTADTKAATSADVLAGKADIYLERYMNEPLLIAPKADAECFVADFEYDSVNGTLEGMPEENWVAYKDLNYSIINGNLDDMAVRVYRYQDEESGSEGETYAKTFAQAVSIIDKIADMTSSYTIEILKTDDSENGYVKTAQSGGTAVYGAMTLPAKAAYVQIICGDMDELPTLAYTGKLVPKCNTEFTDVKLIEGSVDSKKNWIPAKEHAPTVDMGSGKYQLVLPGNDITVGTEKKESNSYTSITAKSGEVILWEKTAVGGTVNVKNLTLEGWEGCPEFEVFGVLTVSGNVSVCGHVSLTGTKAMTLTNIVEAEYEEMRPLPEPSLRLVTYRTALTRTNKVSKTQLTVNGQIDVDTNIQMMVFDEDAQDDYGNTYRCADFEDEEIFLLPEGRTPTDAVKVAVMPKASLEHVKVFIGDSAPLKWKHAKGLYLTDEGYLPIVVTGCVETGEAELEQVYEGGFMTWAQAVAEIDTINDKDRAYTITLYENIGNNASISTLTMPAKARNVTITSDYDSIDEGRAIFFTGTTITLRCPTEFDRIALVAVKKRTSGKMLWYDSAAYRISAGSYSLTMKDMMAGADYKYGTNETVEWLEAVPGVITGNAKAAFAYEQTNLRHQENGYYESGNLQFEMASQVTGFGTFSVKRSLDENGDEFDENSFAELHVSSGVSGITELNVGSNVLLIVDKGNVSAKNAQIHGLISARNFTSTGTVSMNHGIIDAGGYVKNTVTGAVKLNHVLLESIDNQICGRLNRSNQSQIVISGTVSTTEETDGYDTAESEYLANHAPLVIALTYYIREGYAQLFDGMLILQSAKAVASGVDVNTLFAPRYSRRAQWEQDADGEYILKTEYVDGMGLKPDENENYIYKLVKSGKSNIVYQRAAVQ